MKDFKVKNQMVMEGISKQHIRLEFFFLSSVVVVFNHHRVVQNEFYPHGWTINMELCCIVLMHLRENTEICLNSGASKVQ